MGILLGHKHARPAKPMLSPMPVRRKPVPVTDYPDVDLAYNRQLLRWTELKLNDWTKRLQSIQRLKSSSPFLAQQKARWLDTAKRNVDYFESLFVAHTSFVIHLERMLNEAKNHARLFESTNPDP